MDLQARLETVEALVEQLSARKNQHPPSRVLVVCMKNVKDVVEKIHEDLNLIDQRCEEYKMIWFSSWRYPDYGTALKMLREHKSLMDQRVDMLMQILLLPTPGDSRKSLLDLSIFS